MSRISICAGALLLLLFPATAPAQSGADSVAIRRAALDYIEGWYDGNADRMSRALHPELKKRIVEGPANAQRLDEMTAAQLVEATRRRGASARPATHGRKDVRILDVYGGTASVRVDADGWVDYMHLARWNGEWRIVNVLWEMRP